MLQWLATYWLEVAFGLLLGVLAWGGRKLVHFYIKELQEMLSETENKICARIDKQVQQRDEQLEALRAGLLSVQGRTFKKKCHELLDPNNPISVEEMENITKDHDAYKSLGGNHEGDALFALVMEKAKKDIT